jgi:galactose mutarotase-like enzyme
MPPLGLYLVLKLKRGIAVLKISNGKISVKIDETLGGEIRSIKSGRTEYLVDFDWKSPIQHRKSESYGNAIFDWLSEYRGGWQVLFPNAGNENTVMGVALPFHGEFGRTYVEVVTQKKNEITIRAGARLPLVLTRTYKLLPGKPVLTVEQSVTNESNLEVPFIWGEHPAFSLPRGSKIHLPSGPVTVDANDMGDLQDVKPGALGTWPIVPGKSGKEVDLSVVPQVNVERLCYLSDRPQGWAAMEHGKKIIGISWDLKAFPHLWFWQEIGGKGFPWYGRTEITAIEPASTWPSYGLEAAISSGQAFFLKPGETKKAWTTFAVSAVQSKNLTKIKSMDEKGNFKTN